MAESITARFIDRPNRFVIRAELEEGSIVDAYLANTGRLTHLMEPGRAFVTLKKGEELRGCVGYVDGSSPLWEAVARSARAAAHRDNRFAPVEPEEMPEITVEISERIRSEVGLTDTVDEAEAATDPDDEPITLD